MYYQSQLFMMKKMRKKLLRKSLIYLEEYRITEAVQIVIVVCTTFCENIKWPLSIYYIYF